MGDLHPRFLKRKEYPMSTEYNQIRLKKRELLTKGEVEFVLNPILKTD